MSSTYPYNETVCRVCGYDAGLVRWTVEDEKTAHAAYEVCSCCGNHSGIDDLTINDVVKYRNTWLAKGRQWFSVFEDSLPDHIIEEQMSNIPDIYRQYQSFRSDKKPVIVRMKPDLDDSARADIAVEFFNITCNASYDYIYLGKEIEGLFIGLNDIVPSDSPNPSCEFMEGYTVSHRYRIVARIDRLLNYDGDSLCVYEFFDIYLFEDTHWRLSSQFKIGDWVVLYAHSFSYYRCIDDICARLKASDTDGAFDL